MGREVGPGHSSNRSFGALYKEMCGKEAVPVPPAASDPATAFERMILSTVEPHVGKPFDRLADVVGREGRAVRPRWPR